MKRRCGWKTSRPQDKSSCPNSTCSTSMNNRVEIIWVTLKRKTLKGPVKLTGSRASKSLTCLSFSFLASIYLPVYQPKRNLIKVIKEIFKLFSLCLFLLFTQPTIALWALCAVVHCWWWFVLVEVNENTGVGCQTLSLLKVVICTSEPLRLQRERS